MPPSRLHRLTSPARGISLLPATRSILLAWCFALLAPLAMSCSSQGGSGGFILTDVRLSSQVVTPNGQSAVTPITVDYSLSRPASVTAYLLGQAGEKLYLRKDEVRPVAGSYSLAFDGSYLPNPTGVERRVLPSGRYKLLLEARDQSSTMEVGSELEVRDADNNPPRIEGLVAFPATLSPNSDGIDDSTKVTYRTTKKAGVTLFLVGESGKRYVLEREEGQAVGNHSTSWDGQVGNQLLPSGNHRLMVEARDSAGNITVAETSLRLESAMVPDARILSVSFEPRRVILGGLVKVTIRVRNSGNTVLRTQGPDPGYVYDSQEGFSTIGGRAFQDKRGYWRVGADWAGAPGASGSRYPYRWGFGKDLQPGEEATVEGYIRINHRYPQIWLHAGLVQEQVRYWDNEVGRTVIEISY